MVTEQIIQIDQELCPGCGRCVDVCPTDAITGSLGVAHKVSDAKCVGCGACIRVCTAHDTIFEAFPTSRAERLEHRHLLSSVKEPMFAAFDLNQINLIQAAVLNRNAGLFVVAQLDPTVVTAIAEDFGLAAGSLTAGKLVAALKQVGFTKVYDNTLAASIAVLEVADDLTGRMAKGGTLPVINSSCPAAVAFIEQAYPELIYHLTTVKSPQQIGGALAKSYLAKALNVPPAGIYTVSVVSCTARKAENVRPGMGANGRRDVDAVLTARELGYLIKDAGINLASLAEVPFDGELRSVQGMESVYRTTGDVTQAVVHAGRAAAKQDGVSVDFEAVGDGVQMATVPLGQGEIKAIAVSGLENAIPYLDAAKAGKNGFSFIEIMACPMGCVSGAGLPKVLLEADQVPAYQARCGKAPRTNPFGDLSANPAVTAVYQGQFGKAVGDKSNQLLRTQYVEKGVGA